MTFEENTFQEDINTLELVVIKIERYSNSSLDINDLIIDLEDYLNNLVNVDKEWKKKFRKSWAVIEECYAVSKCSGLETLDDEYVFLVNGALSVLKKIAEDKIEELKTCL